MSPLSKKFRLNSGQAPDIYLLGILSDENDLRLVWLMNQQLGIHLSRTAPFQYMNKKLAGAQDFPSYLDNQGESQARLIRNRSNEGLKIADFKEFDYLFVTATPPEEWIGRLKEIEAIRAVFDLDPTQIKEMLLA